jgi:hypothetical protein
MENFKKCDIERSSGYMICRSSFAITGLFFLREQEKRSK